MKKTWLLALIAISFAFTNVSQAQINLSLNLGSQPAWGPTGYDRVEYYYMPDIDAYYYVPKKQFIYLNKNQWVFANTLPSKYSGFNLYKGHKVVINRPFPYKEADLYRNKYARFSGGRGPLQESIRDSKDDRYKNHPGNKGHNGNNGNNSQKQKNKQHKKDH